MRNSSKYHKKHSGLYKALLLIAIVVLAGAIILLIHNHGKKAVSGPIKTITESTKNAGSQKVPTNTQKSTDLNQAPTTSSDSSNSAASTGAALVAPSGSFVSNHKPGQNGSNLTEESECVTTIGASCYIEFSQDGIVKTLASQTADDSGAIFWTWNTQQNGLSSGSWQVEAISSLGSQTKTTIDPLSLEIQ